MKTFISYHSKVENNSEKVDRLFGKDICTSVLTFQGAVEICLELLGAKIQPVPIILPVTAPPELVISVLRGGAKPLLLDVDVKYLQMSTTLLQDILAQLESKNITPVVGLTRPCGQEINPSLGRMVEDLPTIMFSNNFPNPNKYEQDACATLNLYPLKYLGVPRATCIINGHKDLVNDLRILRSSDVGHDLELLPEQVDKLSTSINQTSLDRIDNTLEKKAQIYLDSFHNYKASLKFCESPRWDAFYVQVNNARKFEQYMHEENVEVVSPAFPVYKLDHMKRRWVDAPDYPSAEEAYNTVSALPLRPDLSDKKISRIAECTKHYWDNYDK